MKTALLAIPGRLTTPTGGYAYARALLDGTDPRRALSNGLRPALQLAHWPLPELGLAPSEALLDEVGDRLASAPAGWPVLIDGLALGVLPPAVLARHAGPLAALVHHPLALETGLSPHDTARLAESERRALGAVDAVICTSETTAQTLVADYAIDRARLTVALPGIRKPGATRPAIRAPGPVRLIAVGSLVPRKGHDLLIAALAPLASLSWTLTIIGDDTRDPAHAEALRAAAEAAGLTDRIRFLGATDGETVTALLAAADLFVSASHYEGFGMAPAEAVAAGLPVLCTEAGAIAEATAGAAQLVPSGDAEALTAALATLIDDGEARAALATASQTAAPTLPDWQGAILAVTAALTPLFQADHSQQIMIGTDR
ncbi:MAG: glycosyltransferase [Pseudomonadota bacterium]